MSLRNDLSQTLGNMQGFTSAIPQRVTFAGPNGITVMIDFTAIDTMSCSFASLQLTVPSLQNSAFDALKAWAENLTQRINYLLENIAPLELDPDNGQVLIRSSPPDQLPDGTQFYEIMLASQGNGTFTLKRYMSTKGQAGRNVVDITTTHEVLLKLADDLVDTVP